MTDTEDTPSPAEALDAIRTSRAQLAVHVSKASWAYDLKYSALVGGMVAGQGLPSPWQLVSTGVFILLLVLLLRGWVQRTGVMVTGLTPPKARWVAIGFGLLMGAVMVGVLIGMRKTGLWLIPVGGGLVSAVLALISSRLWWKVYADETGMTPR